MIGVLPLHAGSSVLQAMLVPASALHDVGRFLESLTPSPVGPRHCGQLSLASEAAAPHKTSPNEKYVSTQKSFTAGSCAESFFKSGCRTPTAASSSKNGPFSSWHSFFQHEC